MKRTDIDGSFRSRQLTERQHSNTSPYKSLHSGESRPEQEKIGLRVGMGASVQDFKDIPISKAKAEQGKIKSKKAIKRSKTAVYCQEMQSAAANQISMMTQCISTLDALKLLMDVVAKEQSSFAASATDAQNKLKTSIFILIDDSKALLEASRDARSAAAPYQHIEQKLRAKRRDLQKKLALWMPAYYLINKHLPDQMHTLPDEDDSCDFCAVLGDMRTQSDRYTANRNQFANQHLMLVHSVSNKFRYLGLPYEDIFQEGFIGLLKAVERYQPNKGFQFSTYAHRVIGQSIHLALDKQTHLVRKPFRVLREKASVDNTRKKAEQEVGRALRASELAEKLPDDIEDKSIHLQDHGHFTADSESIWSVNPREFDLAHTEISDEQSRLQVLCQQKHLDAAINELDPRSQDILRMRFGLGINRAHTLAEISENLSLSSERVRQIVIKAIESLSHKFQPKDADQFVMRRQN